MDFCVRQATASDCKEILRLIQELADFELMPEGPKLTEERKYIQRANILFHL